MEIAAIVLSLCSESCCCYSSLSRCSADELVRFVPVDLTTLFKITLLSCLRCLLLLLPLLFLLLWRRFFIIFIFFHLLPFSLSDQNEEEGMAFTVYKYMEILNEIYEFVVNCILIYPKFLYFILFYFFSFLVIVAKRNC